MIKLITYLLACVTIVGCTTSPVDSVTGKIDATININAQPGYIQRYQSEVGNQKILKADFKMRKMQPSERWGPAMMYCLHDKNNIVYTCVRFTRHFGKPALFIQEIVKQLSTSEPEMKPTDYVLSDSELVHVQANIEGTSVQFNVNGIALSPHELEQATTDFSISCSSIICSVDILEVD